MDVFVFEIKGELYTVQDMGPHYNITFPDGHTEPLKVFLDDKQETTFEFENKENDDLAKALGEAIYNSTL